MSSKDTSRSFWKTIPGLLLAAAGWIALIGAAMLVTQSLLSEPTNPATLAAPFSTPARAST